MSTASLRFSTDILQRLGEELITSFDQGIVELVKNSYDADARTCTVELIDTGTPGGMVVVSDDGDGMSGDDIRSGWLVLGRSRKVVRDRTRLGRLPAGSKGLGRLGALRMGDDVQLITRPRHEPNTEYSIRIRWTDFESHAVVEEVALDIGRTEVATEPGTSIEIRNLRNKIGEREVQRLARELLLLGDLFGDPTGFKPALIAPQFKALEELVRRAYFSDCELRLVAELDENGRASARIFDRTGGVRWASDSDSFDENYRAPAATFELWVFLLQRDSFVGRSATVGEVQRWLRQVGGVHLYHRGLRVRPYGDPGHDWLDMNLARARSPELRPSTNTSVGRVAILDAQGELLQKTDRTGFIENEAFRELRRFAVDALEWMQGRRLAEREAQREQQKRDTAEQAAAAGAKLKQAIEGLAPEGRPAVEEAASELESARSSERAQLRADLHLYQTLASVGTAIAVFAHEIEGPATNLTASVKAVQRRARRTLGSKYESTIGPQLEAVWESASLAARFATLPLGLLKRSKRRQTVLNLNATIDATVVLFEPYLRDARIETVCDLSDESAQVRGSVSAIEAIVSNLITNAVKAFKRPDAKLTSRRLVVRTTVTSESVLISVLDSGPGIDSGIADRIWLPGETSDENGTGLGLAIVRDTATDLGGSTRAVANGELGGAEFIVELPREVRGQ